VAEGDVVEIKNHTDKEVMAVLSLLTRIQTAIAPLPHDVLTASIGLG
jgi:hypothetical protein